MKKLLLATALTVASMSANAGVISAAGGVTVIQSDFTTPSQANLQITSGFTQWWTSPINSSVANALLSTNTFEASPAGLNAAVETELVGVGVFESYDGSPDDIGAPTNTAICNGCQLTFSFGGFLRTYDATAVDPLDAVIFNSDNAWLNVYLDYNMGSRLNETNISNAQTVAQADIEVANAVDGDLWLTLDVLNFSFDPDDPSGNPNASGEVEFVGDIVGGDALANFVTDFFSMTFDVDAYGFSATFLDTNGDLLPYSRRGSGNVEARVVSEPGAIALFSLGLIGLGLSARRRMNK
jgi:hypothetical protein